MKIGWIDFKYKTPYSNVPGRKPPYDFPIIVAKEIEGKIVYECSTAIETTRNYLLNPKNYRAWSPIDIYILEEKKNLDE